MFSPDGQMLEIKRDSTVAYVVDRAHFDRLFYKKAKNAGVEIRTETQLIDVDNDSVFVKKVRHGEIIKSKYVVGTDGITSKAREIMGIKVPSNYFVKGYQVMAKGKFDTEFVELYFGDFAKNFFAWVVPESKKIAKVGIGTTEGNAKAAFDRFLEAKNLDIDIVNYIGGVIASGPPIKEIVKDNIMICGDAAFQTKATTGGGILTGLFASEILGDALIEHFKYNAPLENYPKRMAALNKDFELHWKMRKYFNSLSEDGMNKLWGKLNKAKVGEFLAKYGDMDRPTRFMGKILSMPSMWRLLPEALSFLRG